MVKASNSRTTLKIGVRLIDLVQTVAFGLVALGLLAATAIADDTRAFSEINGQASLRFTDAGWSSRFGWGVGCDGAIGVVTESPNGGYYVAGQFSHCGNIVANNIAHLDPATGIWTPLGSDGGNGVNDIVINMVMYRGELFVYGGFDRANLGGSGEVELSRYATWDGSRWAGVDDPGLSQLEQIRAFRVWNDLLYIGGYFQFIGPEGTEHSGIAIWDGDSLSPLGQGSSANVLDVWSIAIHNDELYIGGVVVGAGGVRRWDGEQWATLGSDGGVGLNAVARSLISWNGSLYATGAFTIANYRAASTEVAASRVARWNGTQWSALGAGLSNTGELMVIADDQLVVSGFFTSAGGVAAKQLARWDGQQWTALASDLAIPSFPLAVTSMLSTPDGLLVAGQFPYAEANPASGDPATVLHGIGLVSGGRWRPWESVAGDGFYGNVRAIARYQGDLYVGGEFRTIGGEIFNGIARWNGERWLQVGSGNGNGVNGNVYALLETPEGLQVGGGFGRVNMGGEEIIAGGIARWDGSQWHPVGVGDEAGFRGSVFSLAWAPPYLYAAGSFVAPPAGEFGFAANRIARWNGSEWSVLGDETANGLAGFVVYSLAILGEDLYAGGIISGFNANQLGGGALGAAESIARWDGNQWHRVGSSGVGLGGSGSTGGVFAMTVFDGDLYVGGAFRLANFQASTPIPVRNLVRWDGSEWHNVGGAPDAGVNGVVYSLQVAGDSLLVGGKFGDLEISPGVTEPALGLASLRNDLWITSPSGLQTRGGVAQVSAMLAEADGGVYVGGDFDQAGEKVSVRMAYHRPIASNYSYIYWNPSEPGWGFNLQHQGDLLYGTWYSYAEDGLPMFLTVEALPLADGSFAGPVYRTAGTPFAQINGSQAFTAVTEVGQATMTFDTDGRLNLSYVVNGASQSKQLERFVFDPNPPSCIGTTESRAAATNYSDLWWNDSEAGWGLTLSHQGDTIFALWYTYGEGGRDQWISASAMVLQPDGSYVGALQRPQQGTPLTQIMGAAATAFPVPEIGTAQLRFIDGENGFFGYSVDGVSQNKAIKRFVVVGQDQPKPLCVQ